MATAPASSSELFPPGAHVELWAVQRELDFPGTVYGIPRGTDATTMMRRQAEWYAAHRDDAEA